MSNRPNPFASNEPTGEEYSHRSRPPVPLKFALSWLIESPHGYFSPSLPPRAAYSHSASVGRRPPAHLQYATASAQVTVWTGSSSPCSEGGEERIPRRVASAKRRYCATVTGVIIIRNGAP